MYVTERDRALESHGERQEWFFLPDRQTVLAGIHEGRSEVTPANKSYSAVKVRGVAGISSVMINTNSSLTESCGGSVLEREIS